MSHPDQIYMNHVRDALWSRTGRATVMVGSGFSKNAQPARPNVGELPLWHELARAMCDRLHSPSPVGGHHCDAVLKSDPSAAPRLAQEYKDSFGRTSLHLMLQEHVRDGDFIPGDFHTRLLKLPWRDVFTTNWDTLLERTLPAVPERPYGVVHNRDEIPLSAQPRIIKLHGSLDGHYPLIVAEDDYRTYPKLHAPLVNTVKQAMMETVFCLIGFSGSDPNFLEWSEWVNDNLGDSATRIYVAGWLELATKERERLRSRNVIAIDLARHPEAANWPAHLHHIYATDWILHSLEGGRPYNVADWPTLPREGHPDPPPHLQPVEVVSSVRPQVEKWPRRTLAESESNNESVQTTLRDWRHNRSIYPGWLIAPLEVRNSIASITRGWEPYILRDLPNLHTSEQLYAIREIVWRLEISLEPISSDLESAALEVLNLIDCDKSLIDGLADPDFDWPRIREAYREVTLSLVTAARFRLDKSTFDQRMASAEQFRDDDPDIRHRVSHERCLQAAWSLDFRALVSSLSSWDTKHADQIWTLRKAALLHEIGLDDDAKELIGNAIANIRRFPADDRSLAGPSREGWGLWSLIDHENRVSILNGWNELASLKCNAFAEVTEVTNSLSSANAPDSSPSFELEADHTRTFHFGASNRVAPTYRAIRLSEVAALPPASPTAYPGRATASNLFKLTADRLVMSSPELAVRLVLRSCTSDTDETLKRVLSRTRVAMLSEDAVQRLVADCRQVIDYSLSRGWLDRVRVSLEVLSRLVVRLGSDAILEAFDHALELYANRQYAVLSNPLISTPLQNLLKRTWRSLHRQQRMNRSLDVLGAPIVGLDGFAVQLESRFPDPGHLVLGDSELHLFRHSTHSSIRWQETLSLLLRALRAGEVARRRAASRLLALPADGALTKSETSDVAEALWAPTYSTGFGLPRGTLLYDWAFLTLPEPSPGAAMQGFRAKWLSKRTVMSRLEAMRKGVTTQVTLGESPSDPHRLEDTLWNVGLAIRGMKRLGRSLTLTHKERMWLVCLVSQWLDVPVPHDSDDLLRQELEGYAGWAIAWLSPILLEVEPATQCTEKLFEKLREYTESGIPAYAPVGALVRLMPERTAEIANWLRAGTASGDRRIASAALSGLNSWTELTNGSDLSVSDLPDDILRQLGITIAVRRRDLLSDALHVARRLFDDGRLDAQKVILTHVLEGLGYLADELRYDAEQEAGDIPHLRLRCAQLASSMSKAGLDQSPEVMQWLEIASADPFPEIRQVATGSLGGTQLDTVPNYDLETGSEPSDDATSTRNS